MLFISLFVIYLLALAIFITSQWRIFLKAGYPGWASIVPFYNVWILVKIAKKSVVYFWLITIFSLLVIIPIVGIVFGIAGYVLLLIVWYKVAVNFKANGTLFVLSVIFSPFMLISLPILAFGEYTYTAVDSNRIATAKKYSNPIQALKIICIVLFVLMVAGSVALFLFESSSKNVNAFPAGTIIDSTIDSTNFSNN